MASFSNEEYADILYCYGFCDGDAAAAREEYQRRFPRRNNVPSAGVFSAAYQRVRESGAVHQRRHDAGRPPRYVAEDEEEILEHFARDPTTSTRIVARQLGLTQWKVWFTVHSVRLYPFHYTPVQALHEGDPARRLDFCRFLLHSDENDSNFLKKILWTDKSKFDRDGITNYHNMHFWAPQGENPHLTKEGAHQTRFSLNVWMGILHNHVIGPFFLPNNLNGESYENFLRNNLDELLEDVPIGTRRGMIYQHDGCPAHYRVTVRQWLDQKFPQRWIGRDGPIPWPARSPDLTPCDYYLWGHMKSLVYTTPISDVHELRGRVIHAANEIRETLTSRVTRSNLRLRLRRCIRNQGRQFEQDLP